MDIVNSHERANAFRCRSDGNFMFPVRFTFFSVAINKTVLLEVVLFASVQSEYRTIFKNTGQ